MQQTRFETEKVPLRPDSMCQFAIVDMKYYEARNIMRDLRHRPETWVELSVCEFKRGMTCVDVSDTLDAFTFNVMFGYIPFRDVLEIVNLPDMYEFMDTKVRVKTLEGLRYVAFEGTMSELAAYTL